MLDETEAGKQKWKSRGQKNDNFFFFFFFFVAVKQNEFQHLQWGPRLKTYLIAANFKNANLDRPAECRMILYYSLIVLCFHMFLTVLCNYVLLCYSAMEYVFQMALYIFFFYYYVLKIVCLYLSDS